MPKIPKYQKQTKRGLLHAPKADVKVPSGTLGARDARNTAALGGDLLTVGNALAGRANEIRNEQDGLAATESYLAANNELRVIMYGEDGKGGYYSQKGANAAKVTSNLQNDFDKIENKYMSQLENDTQRKLFKAELRKTRASQLMNMARYEAKQHQVRKREGLDAMMTSYIEQALNSYDRPLDFDKALTLATIAKKARLQLDGVDSEVVKSEVNSMQSKMYASAIKRLAKDSPAQAQKWFDKVEDKMLAVDVVGAEGFIKERNQKVLAQSKTDEIMSIFGSDESFHSIEKEEEMALQFARKIEDPDTRDKVVERVKIRFAEKRRLKGEDKDKDKKGEAQEESDEILKATDSEKIALEMARDIEDSDLRDRVVKRVKARFAEKKRIKQENENAIEDGLTQGILAATSYENAIAMAEEAPNVKAKMRLLKLAESRFRDKIIRKTEPVKFQEALERIDRTLQGVAKEGDRIRNIAHLEAEYSPYMTPGVFEKIRKYYEEGGNISSVKNATLKQIFLHYTGKSPEDKKELYEAFWNHTIDSLIPGEKPTEDFLRKNAVKFFTEGEKRGRGLGYGKDMTYGQALEKGVADTWLPEVTDEEKEMIIKKIKKYNKKYPDNPVNIDEIKIREYKKYIILGIKEGRKYKE